VFSFTGSLLFNPINAGLVIEFGWRVAFRVASGIIFVTGMACCWTFTAKSTPNMERLVEESDSQPATPKTEKVRYVLPKGVQGCTYFIVQYPLGSTPTKEFCDADDIL
jgi:hypothetical protein